MSDLVAQPPNPDPLIALQKSRTYRKKISDKNPYVANLYSEKWFSRLTWYGRAFLDENGGSMIFDWLGTDTDQERQQKYTGGAANVLKEREAMTVKREFVTPTFKKIQVTIVLPHPRTATACGERLVAACDALITPPAQRFHSDPVPDAAAPTEYVQTVDNSCLYLTHLPKYGLMQVKSDLCSDAAELKEFFGHLDIKTFAARLNT